MYIEMESLANGHVLKIGMILHEQEYWGVFLRA